MSNRPEMTLEDDRWGRRGGDYSAPSSEEERLRRELAEANRRADTMQERLNLQKQATIQEKTWGKEKFRLCGKKAFRFFTFAKHFSYLSLVGVSNYGSSDCGEKVLPLDRSRSIQLLIICANFLFF